VGAGCGDFHDQADAEWIVFRGQLRGHIDTPCGRPTGWLQPPTGLSATQGLATLRAYFVFSVTLFFNIVRAIMELTFAVRLRDFHHLRNGARSDVEDRAQRPRPRPQRLRKPLTA
jgi:hypothetical protein